MPAQPKEILEKILATLGFPATVEEHKLEEGLLLDVKTGDDDDGRFLRFRPVEGKVDLTASALRELKEETAIVADEVAFAPGWTVVYAPPRIACLKVMRLSEPAEAAKARVEAFLAADPNAELAGMRVVRGPADFDRTRAPGFIVDFLDFAFAHKSAG